jgi:hypothetical protein
MITPRFSIAQDEVFIIVTIRVPHVRVSATEVDISGAQLSVWCTPYLLQLVLPGELLDDERATAEYDANDAGGTLVVRAAKAVEGEHFPDLDLAGRVLAPRASFPTAPSASLAHQSALDSAALENDDDDGDKTMRALNAAFSASTALGARETPSANPITDGFFNGRSLSGVTDSSARAAAGVRESASVDFRARRGTPLIEVIESIEFNDTVDAGGGSSATASASRTAESAPPPNAPSAPKTTDATPAPPAVRDAAEWSELISSGCGYGFNRRHTQVFAGLLRSELCVGLLHTTDPEGLSASARSAARFAAEHRAWDPERYAGDEAEGEGDALYQCAVTLDTWWARLLKALEPESSWAWTQEEADDLASLPRVELLVDGDRVGGAGAAAAIAASAEGQTSCGPETARAFGGLASLLFAYAYDYRMTGGEAGVETPWTLVALSPLLAWLDDDLGVEAAAAGVRDRVREALSLGVRRALIYPYMRRWDLAVLCVGDVASILLAGRRAVIRALLDMRRTFSRSHVDSMGHYYLMNTLFINDYLVWAQGAGGGLFSVASAAAAECAAALATDPSSKTRPPFDDLNLEEVDAAVHSSRGGAGEDYDDDDDSDGQ